MTAIAVCVQEREVDICSLCVGGGGGEQEGSNSTKDWQTHTPFHNINLPLKKETQTT